MPLNDFESQLVTFIDQQYNLTGVFLSADKAFSDFGIPVGKYEAALKNPDVREALTERGVVFERFEKDDWTSKSLTPLQLLVANALLDLTDTRTNKKKIQDLGVSTVQYNAWLKDPVFKSYLAQRAEQLLGDSHHEANLALLDRIRAGDMKAIEYYNEMTGVYTRPRASQGSSVDIQGLIIKIIEIIDEEVSDPDTLTRLSNRLRGLIAARNTAAALVGDTDEQIVVPQVVQARPVKELT